MNMTINLEDCCVSVGTSDTGCCGGTDELTISDEEGIRAAVRAKYAEVAAGRSCCGGDDNVEIIRPDRYKDLDGYEVDADLGLGCGIPTGYAGIAEGNTAVDLGSGAGIDAFIARNAVGDTGHVIGVDFTPEMIAKATENADKLGYSNVEFRLGEITDLPVDSSSVDVVVSNCVLNLVPDKRAAFAEIERILNPGGHFVISDIVTLGHLPVAIRESVSMYTGCVSGAVERQEYLELIDSRGFEDIEVKSEHTISLPRTMLEEYATREEVDEIIARGGLVASITVHARKPGKS